MASEQHQYLNRGTRLNTPTIKTSKYGSNSITLEVMTQWNTIQNSLKFNINHARLTRPKWHDERLFKQKNARSITYHKRHHKAKPRYPYSHVCFPFSSLLFFLTLSFSHFHCFLFFLFLFISLICSLWYSFSVHLKYFLQYFECNMYIGHTYLVWANMLAMPPM